MDNMQAAISHAMDNLNNLKWFRRLPKPMQERIKAAMQEDVGELDQSSPIAAIVTLAITATGQELVIKQIEHHLGPQIRILGVNLN